MNRDEEILEKLNVLCQRQAELMELMKAMDVRLALPDRMVMTSRWLKSNEVMDLLGVSARTLYAYTQAGAFEIKRMGGTLFYTRESVMRMKV